MCGKREQVLWNGVDDGIFVSNMCKMVSSNRVFSTVSLYSAEIFHLVSVRVPPIAAYDATPFL